MEENHLFARSHEELTLDQRREITVRRINEIIKEDFVSLADVSELELEISPETVKINSNSCKKISNF